MRYYCTSLFILILHSFSFSQTYYLSTLSSAPTSNTIYSLNYPDCNPTALFTCPPVMDVNQANFTNYMDIAVYDSTLYYITGGTNDLYSQSITGAPACQYLGNFNANVNSLVADTAGNLYTVGIQNNVSKLMRYQSGIFTTVGDFPANIYSIGDLFFYEHRLFMIGTHNMLGIAFIMEVDMVNPGQSCIYMPLPTDFYYGAFSIRDSLISRSFIFSVDDATSTSTMHEINIPCKTLGPVLCTFPWKVTGAASKYNMTSNNAIATCTSSAMTPTLTISGNLSTCPFQSTTLTAQGAVNYTWSTSAQTSSISVSPATSTSYILEGSFADNCIVSSTVITVNVIPSYLSLNAPAGACKDQTVTIYGIGANSYTWSTGDNSSFIEVSPSVTTTYSLTGSETSGCINTITTNVIAYPLSNVSIVGSESVCKGSSMSLTANGAVSYTWNTMYTGNQITVSPTDNTKFSINATDVNGCPASSSISVIVFTVPVLSVSGIFSVCAGNATTLYAGGAENYIWNSNETTSGVIVRPHLNTVYTVTGLNENNCSSSATVQVIVKPIPELVVTEVKIFAGQSATLSVQGGVSYLWEAQPYMSCLTCSNPIVSPERTTRYCVLVTGEYCKNDGCVNVEVSCNGDFFIPNAFSPNSDGINDEFCMQGLDACIQKFSVSIFNRWGEKVYESNKSTFCWDGFFDGQRMNTQVLVYLASFRFKDGHEETRKGSLTLMR